MAQSKWDENNIPDQTGRVVIITGSTSGIGLEGARMMASKNATVVMAVRNIQKGEKIADTFRRENRSANIEVVELDLASLRSVNDFSDTFSSIHDRLDILINNAGIMFCPYSKTEDGFEIQMGTNHLGHFALTGHLMPLLKQTEYSRIVATSSTAHRHGNIDFSDINWERRSYSTIQAYSDSKLANLLFMHELTQKLNEDSNAPIITAAHPGWTRSDLQRHSRIMRFLNTFFSQGPEKGILPSLRAAIDPNASSGDYFGPAKLFETRGHPVKVNMSKRANNQKATRKLWKLSEELTGVQY